MPYIDQKNRKNIEPELNALIQKLKCIPTEKIDGNLNYCICRVLKELYPASYYNYNRSADCVRFNNFNYWHFPIFRL